MPYYKDRDDLVCKDHPWFDEPHDPGFLAPRAGIYACEWCGFEALLKERDEFPDAASCGLHGAAWHPDPNMVGFKRVKWRLVALPIRQSGLD
jgi:hypothetical protein